MADFSRFVSNKLNGEWSASNVSGMLTDTIIEYLVAGEKWESLDPLVRSRLLLAPLFMRKRDLAEMRPALGKLAAAGAADKDEWVRAMAQSVDGYDGRLHTDRLLAGSSLVAKTVAGLQPLLASADTRLFRPQEELYMNKELLQKLRESAPGGAQQAQQPAGAGPGKQHHHFRLRPASEAPSQRQAGGLAAPGRAQQAGLGGAAGSGAQPFGGARTAAAPLHRPGGGVDRDGGAAGSGAPGGATSRLGRQAAADIDSMFLPRKPALGRPGIGGLGGRGRGAAAAPQQPRRAATIDVEDVKSLQQQRQAQRERELKAKREAAEAEAKARAEARERERAVKEAEKEVEAKRLAAARAAEKAAAKEAKGAAKADGSEAKAAAKAAKLADKAAQEGAAAAKAATKAAKAAEREQRKRPAPGPSEGAEPPAKRPAAAAAASSLPADQREAAAVVAAAAAQRPVQPAPALLSPEATAAALGDAALAAAADAAGMSGAGVAPTLEAMHSFLSAAYGGSQRAASSDEGEEDLDI